MTLKEEAGTLGERYRGLAAMSGSIEGDEGMRAAVTFAAYVGAQHAIALASYADQHVTLKLIADSLESGRGVDLHALRESIEATGAFLEQMLTTAREHLEPYERALAEALPDVDRDEDPE